MAESSQPVGLVVHSGASIPGYAANDRRHAQIAAMVYIDHGPATAAFDADLDAVELPLPAREERDPDNIRGMTDEEWAWFCERAVPEPGGVIRGTPVLTDERRRHIPSRVDCTSRTTAPLQSLIPQGGAWLSALPELTNFTYVDLPPTTGPCGRARRNWRVSSTI